MVGGPMPCQRTLAFYSRFFQNQEVLQALLKALPEAQRTDYELAIMTEVPGLSVVAAGRLYESLLQRYPVRKAFRANLAPELLVELEIVEAYKACPVTPETLVKEILAARRAL